MLPDLDQDLILIEGRRIEVEWIGEQILICRAELASMFLNVIGVF